MNNKGRQDESGAAGGMRDNEASGANRREGDHPTMGERPRSGRHGKTINVFELARRVYASAKTSRRSK